MIRRKRVYNLQKNTTTKIFSPSNRKKSYEYTSSLIPFNAKEIAYSDLIGRFLHKSSRGNQYLLLLYDYDSNGILVEPLKTRQAGEITTAWEKLHTKFNNNVHVTKHYILDNECSLDSKAAFKKVSYELTPPNMHRRNSAEKSIRTF